MNILSLNYWETARKDCHNLRVLTFSAMMVAVCLALSYIPSIYILDKVRITWGFLGRALCGMVGGPFNALLFGFAEDLISYLMHPTGPFFLGYTLTTMLGTFIYSLCLYKQRVTMVRVFIAKFLTNALNVVLGSLWSAMLYGKGYLYYASTSLVKNIVMLPIQAIMLYLLIVSVLPLLERFKLYENNTKI